MRQPLAWETIRKFFRLEPGQLSPPKGLLPWVIPTSDFDRYRYVYRLQGTDYNLNQATTVYLPLITTRPASGGRILVCYLFRDSTASSSTFGWGGLINQAHTYTRIAALTTSVSSLGPVSYPGFGIAEVGEAGPAVRGTNNVADTAIHCVVGYWEEQENETAK